MTGMRPSYAGPPRDQIVFVVGGVPEGSIGHAVVWGLLREGYQVVLFDRPPLDEALTAFESSHRLAYYPLELMHRDTIVTTLEDAVYEQGSEVGTPIVGLVYAAGVNQMSEALDTSVDANLRFDRHLQLNTIAPWLVSSALRNALLKDPQPWHYGTPAWPFQTLVLGSNTAYVAKTRSFMYAASKAGLLHMLRCLHRELAPSGWEYTSLDFGIVMDSDMTNQTYEQLETLRGWGRETTTEMLLKTVPTGRPVTRAEIAEWILFLLEHPGFSAGGSSIRIDGGQQQG